MYTYINYCEDKTNSKGLKFHQYDIHIKLRENHNKHQITLCLTSCYYISNRIVQFGYITNCFKPYKRNSSRTLLRHLTKGKYTKMSLWHSQSVISFCTVWCLSLTCWCTYKFKYPLMPLMFDTSYKRKIFSLYITYIAKVFPSLLFIFFI